MNDTHRTNTTIRDIVDRMHRDSQPQTVPQRAGDLTGEVRDALNTQTTLPNSATFVESVKAAGRRLLEARQDGEAPPGWRNWYMEGMEDLLEAITTGNDSGKSGTTAAIDEFAGGYALAPRNYAVRGDFAASGELGAAMYGDADAPHDPAKAMANAGTRPFHLPEPFEVPIGKVVADVRVAALERKLADMTTDRDALREMVERKNGRIADAERERDTARDLAVLFRDKLRTQTDLVDRLTDAVEREANDIGGEGSMTVLRLLGPNLASAKAALATEGIVATADAKEAAHYAAVGALKEEGEDYDPTPEAQAETFQAIAAEPRPSAVAIKAALERGDEIIRKVLRWTPRSEPLRYVPTWAECATMGFDLRAMLDMLDSLGVHCLALEIERDGLSAQLDRIADQAKPIDGTDLAELVQKARDASTYIGRGGMWHGSSGAMHGRSIGGAETANMIDRLIAAVNDQGRRLREAETNAEQATALILDAYPAVRLVNDWATWSDASLYAYADAILRKVLPEAPAADAIVDALAEIRKVARGRLGDNGFTIPPSYDDAARDKAAEKAREIWPGLAMRDGWHVIVDGIAQTLGLVRAQ